MIIIKLVGLGLLLWYLCGIFNVMVFQINDESDFDPYFRSGTLWLCYGPAPILTLIIIGYLIIIKPVKYGTRLGRFIGRKLEDILN